MKTWCRYYNSGICSSCTQIDQEYTLQVDNKFNKLNTLLAKFSPFESLEIVRSSPHEFRNKAKITITGSVDMPIIGLTGLNDLDEGREILECSVHHPIINEVLKALPDFIKTANLAPYQIKARTGELKGAILYYSSESGEMYLRFILRSKESLDRIKKHSHLLLTSFPFIKSLSANIQPIPHAILEGDEEIFFTTQQYINHSLQDIHMTLHPQGFVQTNQEMATKLYATAASWVRDIGPAKFMELYSGQGAFSFFIQKYVGEAVGVEINAEAVARANSTAKNLNLNHLKFIAQDAAKVKDVMLDFEPDLLLVNPPRKGLGQAAELLKVSKARYFIYSSCNAETLALDLESLKDHYKIVKVQVFDMFPHTDHYETLVLLESTTAYRT